MIEGQFEQAAELLAAVEDKWQLLHGEDVNGYTPLEAAGIGDGERTPMVEWLLAQGEDINYRSQVTGGAISRSIEEGTEKMFDFLVSIGADIHSVNRRKGRKDNTILTSVQQIAYLRSAEEKSVPEENILRKLLAYGADVNFQNHKGETALHLAVKQFFEPMKQPECPDIIALLIEHGADPNLRSLKGETAWDIAQRNQDVQALEIMKAARGT